jgi:hypothetical protein
MSRLLIGASEESLDILFPSVVDLIFLISPLDRVNAIAIRLGDVRRYDERHITILLLLRRREKVSVMDLHGLAAWNELCLVLQ